MLLLKNKKQQKQWPPNTNKVSVGTVNQKYNINIRFPWDKKVAPKAYV